MTTDTMTLTDFLLKCVAADEAAAEFEHDDDCGLVTHPEWSGCDCQRERRRRTLAECEAKRRIMAEHAEKRVGAVTFDPTVELSREYMTAVFNARTGTQCARCFDNGPVAAPCRTLRALALPYVDHPEFREEWR